MSVTSPLATCLAWPPSRAAYADGRTRSALSFTSLAPVLDEITRDDMLRLLLPHTREMAAHLPQLAPHLPHMLRVLSNPKAPLRTCLPALFHALPALLPHMSTLLLHADALGERLPALMAKREDLIEELRTMSAARGKPGADEQGGVWSSIVGFFGGADEANAAGPASAGASTLGALSRAANAEEEGEAAVDLSRVNAAIDAAARRMASLESEFVAVKRDHAFHLSHEHEIAQKCANLEEVLADSDDAICALHGKSHKLREALNSAEAGVGAEMLSHAREARQAEIINGAGSRMLPMPYHPPAAAPPAERKSIFASFEETLLSNIAL